MLFDEIIEYCFNEYSKKDKHTSCNKCTNDNKECAGNCNKCLEEIHWHKENGRKFYNCQNLANAYVCRFLNKHTSEMLHTLNAYEHLKEYKDFNILSIGCGPAPDLMAFEKFIEMNHLNSTISYIGIDIEKNWSSINNKINGYAKDNKLFNRVDFYYIDAVKHFVENQSMNANILILQNVVSHFLSTGQYSSFKKFFVYLAANVVSNMKEDATIIFSDVNSHVCGRDAFTVFEIILKKMGINMLINDRKCFDMNIGKYGKEHQNNNLLFTYPEGLESSGLAWESCSGAQLIIRIANKALNCS